MAAPDRWISRNLVALLIGMRDYESAGEVVSGVEDVFSMYLRMIDETIAQSQELPAGVPSLDLQRVLDTATDDVGQYDQWRDEVLASLPKQDEEDGLTGPLRQAFAKVTRARDELLQKIKAAREKYLKAAT